MKGTAKLILFWYHYWYVYIQWKWANLFHRPVLLILNRWIKDDGQITRHLDAMQSFDKFIQINHYWLERNSGVNGVSLVYLTIVSYSLYTWHPSFVTFLFIFIFCILLPGVLKLLETWPEKPSFVYLGKKRDYLIHRNSEPRSIRIKWLILYTILFISIVCLFVFILLTQWF